MDRRRWQKLLWHSIVTLLCLAMVAPAFAAEPDPKPSLSRFEMRVFNNFISYDLSRPKLHGLMENMGLETRTVRGRALAHTGRPIVGALVALCEDIGYSGNCCDENFDITDQLGRFFLVGGLDRTRVVVAFSGDGGSRRHFLASVRGGRTI